MIVPKRPILAALAVVAGAMIPAAMDAQERAAPIATSYDAAARRLAAVSPALSGAAHASAAARETAAAVATLRRPLVTASAQYIEYQKTLSVDLTGAKQSALTDGQAFLGDLPATFPPSFQAIAADITARLSQALPGLFSAIPDSLSYRYRDEVFRPTVQAIVPIYSGGAIAAIQRGARAGIATADARAVQARDAARLNLIRLYFGQGAAASLEESTRESRDALEKLLGDARKLEAAGVIAHVRVLESQVARDNAERAYQRAALAHASVRDELARLLEVQAVEPTTPLFVASRPLPPASAFLGSDADIAQVRQADAAGEIARAGVDLARARYRPQAFGFGEYNLNRDNALPTEPDWVVGVGVRYTILSNVDRGRALNAARETAAAADDAAREARKTATSATFKAWDLVEAARRSFLLLDSTLGAARENLRVQQVSFREGEGTLTAVLGAEAALATARAERAAIAYEYDLALAGLLAATGRLDAFADHIAKADITVATGAKP